MVCPVPPGLWPANSAAVQNAIEQLWTDSDRAAAIVGAAILEDQLIALLDSRTHSNDEVDQRLFRSSGPFSTMSAKIDLAFKIGVIGTELLAELHLIRRIRNAFAHDLGASSFDAQQIRDLCANLKLVGRYVAEQPPAPSVLASMSMEGSGVLRFTGATEMLVNPRGRFLLSVQLVAFLLHRVPSLAPATPTPVLPA